MPSDRRHGLFHSPEIVAGMALVCVYLALIGGHLYSIDGLLMYHQALSLAYAHMLHLSPPVLWGLRITNSKYGLGLSLLYLPGVILWSWLAPSVPQSNGNPYNWAMFAHDPLYTVAAAPIQILIAAASAFLVARLLPDLGFGNSIALWGLALYGLASPAIVYAKADWAQPLAGLCWISALVSVLRFGRNGERRYLWTTAAVVGYGVLVRPAEGTLLLPVILALLAPHFRVSQWPRAVWQAMGLVAASYLAGMAVTMVVNWVRYGSALDFGYPGEGWTAPLTVSLPATLISPGWGIVWEFPAILLVPVGLYSLYRRGQGKLSLALVGLIVAQLLNTASWYAWAGGWNWGLRLFLPALPLAAVLAGAGIDALSHRARMWVPWLLFAGGVLWATPCVLTNLLDGYAGMVSGGPIYVLKDYPPIGVWQFLHSWRDVDILWVQAGTASGYASLVPALILLGSAVALAARARQLVRDPKPLPAERL